MNPLSEPGYLLPPLLATGFSAGLCLLVVRRAWRSRAHRYFLLFLLTIGAWSFLIYLMRSSPDVEQALFWERIVVPVMLLSPPAFYLFARTYTRIEPIRFSTPITLAYCSAVVVVPMGMLVERVVQQGYGYAPILAPGFYPLAVAGYGLIGLGIASLYLGHRAARSHTERNRLLYIAIGAVFPVAGTVLDIFPGMYPAGIFGNLVFATVTTVAMRRYHLLDVSLVVRKGAAYLVVSVLVAVPYVGAILVATQLAHGSQVDPYVYLALVLALALVLQPLWTRVQLAVDRLFFRRRWDSFRALEEFTQRSHSIAELREPASEVVEIIRWAVQARGAALLQPSEAGVFASIGSSGQDELSGLCISPHSPLALWMGRRRRPVERGSLDLEPQLQVLTDADRDALDRAQAVLLVPLHMRERLSGILALGPKLAGIPYSGDDLALLSMIASQAAVLLDDARLYEATRSQLEEGRRQLEALQVAASRLALERDPQRALQDLVDTATNLVSARYGALTLYDAGGLLEKWIVSPLAAEGDLAGVLLAAGTPGGGHPKEQAEPPSSDSTLTPPMFSDLPPAWWAGSAVLSVPVVQRGRPPGTLYVVGKQKAAAFSADDGRILNLFAVLAQVLLENMELYSAVAQERGILSAIQASITEGLVVLDSRGRVRYCNEAAGVLHGRQSPSTVLGQTLEEALGRRRGDVETPESLETLFRIARQEQPLRSVELRLLNPSAVDIVVTPFLIPVEPEARMVGLLARDVTQERDVDRRRNEFVSIVSHELRTPMTTITGFAELLLQWGGLDERQRECVEHIYRDSQRLSGIVEDLLDVSRIQSGRARVVFSPFSVREAVEGVVRSMGMTTDRHRFVTAIDPTVSQVVSDHDKFVQVVTNLVGNAVKYSPGGGAVTVTARADVEQQRAVVSVADQGIGIAPEDQRALFTVFSRVLHPDAPAVRGSGLGLYIVKSLLELMGGAVWVESEVGRGSTFSFSLPLRPVAEVPPGMRGPG